RTSEASFFQIPINCGVTAPIIFKSLINRRGIEARFLGKQIRPGESLPYRLTHNPAATRESVASALTDLRDQRLSRETLELRPLPRIRIFRVVARRIDKVRRGQLRQVADRSV